MAASSEIPKNSLHTRSISLPKVSPTCEVEEHLCRLRSSEQATSSSSSICHNLNSLQDLYICIEEFLLSSQAQKSISSGAKKHLDQMLNGSLKALDVCGVIREVLSELKTSVQDLQSGIRRRGAESCVANEIRTYLSSRKKANKLIIKCLVDVKKMKNEYANQDNDVFYIVHEVESITMSVFESILCYLSGANTKSKNSKWSLVSKLTHNRSIQRNSDTSEVVKADVALNTIISRKSFHVIEIQNSLEALELNIQGFEDGLECLFRNLIKTQVSFLNMLNQY